jgi:D-galactarolactone cycloisomerase
VRKAIGPDVKLAVDANHCFSVPNAIKLGRMLEEHDILWFEEPISPEDHDGYIEVTRRARHGGGGWRERLHALGLSRRHRQKAMDIVQPDLCAAGGFSECRKIATLASAFGVECVPHAWGSAIGPRGHGAVPGGLPDQPPASGRCRRCSSSSRRPTRCAITWRTEPIEQKKGIVKCRPAPASASRSIASAEEVQGGLASSRHHAPSPARGRGG